ncbi:MAG: hypothetical protein SVT52_02775 [Planctomycetota bacterium]|nr:hypothetical protein [Planctomycetota bacterium]
MATKIPFRDSLYRLAQIGDPSGIRLVRIQQLHQNNQYTAAPIEFDDDGATQLVDDGAMIVTNLAEPADEPGQVPAETDAVALDVEGRWIVFLRQAGTTTSAFASRVVSSQSGAAYTVRPQLLEGSGEFSDDPEASDITASNLAELSLGPGAAVDVDTIVLITMLMDEGNPPTVRYFFDHPAYAKYLD